MQPIIKVIIPAHNEETSIAKVLREIPKDIVNEIIVVNNASVDDTARVAKEAGATVLHEPTPGYGRACLKGIEYCKSLIPAPSVVVFIDGDYSDFPEEMNLLASPILKNEAD
ncbi:MAG: glycosyltransferase family 2 protein, partial [Bacteroidota bacterium]